TFEPYTLTALDHLLMPTYVCLLPIFRVKEPSACIPILEAGIARFFAEFPFLAGTVTKVSGHADKSNVLQVRPPTEAFLDEYPFVKVKHHSERISHMSCVRGLHEDLIPIPYETPTGYPTPGLRFQIGVMKDGVVLCVQWHHRLMDGVGCAIAIECLARCCCSPQAARIKFLTSPREQKAMREQIQQSTRSGVKSQSQAHVGAYGPFGYRYLPSQISVNYVFNPKRVETLESVCNDGPRGSSPSSNAHAPLTSDDVVTTLIWLCATRARHKASESVSSAGLQTSSLMRYVECRRALQPPLPLTYMGNAIGTGISHCTIEDCGLGNRDIILVNGRPEVSPETGRCLRRLASMATVTKQSVAHDFVSGILARMHSTTDWDSCTLTPVDVSVSSLRKLPLYGLDFGPTLGRVVDVEVLESVLHGQCAIKPAKGRGPDVPWEVRMAFPSEVLARLEEDELFRWV
ncbi:hypothetical protein BO70DRAFT_270571, partial [Aspergillus heteromorphus CBS 117.55]